MSGEAMSDTWHCAQIPNGDNPLIVCQRADLRAEVDRLTGELERLRVISEAAQRELREEHQRDEQVDGCVMCWPKDGHWPCTSALIADDLAAANQAGEEAP